MSNDITLPNLQPGVDPKQLGQWMAANIFQQKYATEKAYLESNVPNASIPDMIPFGSNIVINQSPATSQQAPVSTDPIVNTNPPVNATISSPEVTATNTAPINTVPNSSGLVATIPAVNQPNSLNKIAQAAVIAIGLAGGGLGLSSLLNKQTTTPVVNTPVSTPTQNIPADPVVNTPAEQYIEGVLEWEFDSEKGLNLKQNDTNTPGVKPSTNRNIPTTTETIAGRFNK